MAEATTTIGARALRCHRKCWGQVAEKRGLSLAPHPWHHGRALQHALDAGDAPCPLLRNGCRLSVECLQCGRQRAQGQSIQWAPLGQVLSFNPAIWTAAIDWLRAFNFSRRMSAAAESSPWQSFGRAAGLPRNLTFNEPRRGGPRSRRRSITGGKRRLSGHQPSRPNGCISTPRTGSIGKRLSDAEPALAKRADADGVR